jgi:SAM-dependent methyltransferase
MSDTFRYRRRLYSGYRSGQGQEPGFDDRVLRRATLARVVRRHFPTDRGTRILDLGCGAGTFVDHLRGAGYRSVTGVDAAEEQIRAGLALGIDPLISGELLAQVFRVTGFRRVGFDEDDPAVHGIRSATRWLLWRLIRLILRFYTAVETGSLAGESVFTRNLVAVARKD